MVAEAEVRRIGFLHRLREKINHGNGSGGLKTRRGRLLGKVGKVTFAYTRRNHRFHRPISSPSFTRRGVLIRF